MESGEGTMKNEMERKTVTPFGKCYECKGAMEGKREDYHYRESGLSSVVLEDILVYHCKNCRASVPEIPAVGVLHMLITWKILQKNSLLSADEIRFVRKAVGYSATELAKVMGVNKVSVSRWESGSQRIGKESDRLLRLVCFAKIVEIGGNAEAASGLIEVARSVRSLNLANLLKQIDNVEKGAKKVRINPAELTPLGMHPESPQSPILQ